jgi:hypothetical protein
MLGLSPGLSPAQSRLVSCVFTVLSSTNRPCIWTHSVRLLLQILPLLIKTPSLAIANFFYPIYDTNASTYRMPSCCRQRTPTFQGSAFARQLILSGLIHGYFYTMLYWAFINNVSSIFVTLPVSLA